MTKEIVLRFLAHQSPNNPLTQREIARALGLDHSTVNEQLKSLEREGLLVGRGKWKNRKYIASPEAAKHLDERLRVAEAKLERQDAVIRGLIEWVREEEKKEHIRSMSATQLAKEVKLRRVGKGFAWDADRLDELLRFGRKEGLIPKAPR
jgi:DNA-binding MarR family transcriptional regulator